MIKNKELHNIMKITVDTREIVPVFDRVGPIFEPTPVSLRDLRIIAKGIPANLRVIWIHTGGHAKEVLTDELLNSFYPDENLELGTKAEVPAKLETMYGAEDAKFIAEGNGKDLVSTDSTFSETGTSDLEEAKAKLEEEDKNPVQVQSGNKGQGNQNGRQRR